MPESTHTRTPHTPAAMPVGSECVCANRFVVSLGMYALHYSFNLECDRTQNNVTRYNYYACLLAIMQYLNLHLSGYGLHWITELQYSLVSLNNARRH